MQNPILVADSLHMRFRTPNGGVEALRGVTFTVDREEFVCVVGPSGCGKTTLLRLLAGLISPTRGKVLFEGNVLERPRRRIGFVFQQANLMPWRTAFENITLPLELGRAPTLRISERAQELIELVGLEGFEGTYPRDLSGGMAQRVAIARGLIHEPELLLLDEPFGSLDALTRERMGAELMRIWSARTVTVVMVTHSISEAVLLADRVVALGPRPGTVCLDLRIPLGRPRNLSVQYTHRFGELASQVREAIGDTA
jgi:NitT/TauT family transport system ATP-binding protein